MNISFVYVCCFDASLNRILGYPCSLNYYSWNHNKYLWHSCQELCRFSLVFFLQIAYKNFVDSHPISFSVRATRDSQDKPERQIWKEVEKKKWKRRTMQNDSRKVFQPEPEADN